MSLWVRTRERDHRDYSYLTTDRMDQALWLNKYNKGVGAQEGHFFMSTRQITEDGGYLGTYEFDVYTIVDGKLGECLEGEFGIAYVFQDAAFTTAFREAFPLKEAKND